MAFHFISKCAKKISTLESSVKTNTENIETNKTQINTNTNNIKINADNITANKKSIKRLQPYIAIGDNGIQKFDITFNSNGDTSISNDLLDLSEDGQTGVFSVKTKTNGYYAVGGHFVSQVSNELSNYIIATMYGFYSNTYDDLDGWISGGRKITEAQFPVISQTVIDGRSLGTKNPYTSEYDDFVSPFVYVESDRNVVINVEYNGVAIIYKSPMYLYYFPAEMSR